MKICKNKLVASAIIIVIIAVAIWSSLWYSEQTPINPPNNTATSQQILPHNHPEAGASKTLRIPPPRSTLQRILFIIRADKRLGKAAVLDAAPWNNVPPSPYPSLPFSEYLPLPNNTAYLRSFAEALVKGKLIDYREYMLPEGVALIIVETKYRGEDYSVVYSFIENITEWASKLAQYSVITLSLGTTCEDALSRLLRSNLTESRDIIWRIPFPWNGSAQNTAINALALVEMPVFGRDWPLSLRLLEEKMAWTFIASPAIFYALNQTLPTRISPGQIYVDVLPRVVKAIVLPGVTYYPITKYYETPVMIRLTGRGVCKDYAYATAFLADSLGLMTVDMFGVDPRTGVNHSLSGIIIPSSMGIGKGVQIIPDIAGDNAKEYLFPLVDTAKVPLNLLVKAGFTKHMIIDPGIPILGMDPYREGIDYYWYIQYLEGLDKDYRSMPRPFKPPWADKIDKQMLVLAHLYTGITTNYTGLATELVERGEITSKTFSWFYIGPVSLHDAFNLSLSEAPLDITSYAPKKWVEVFTEFFTERIITPFIMTISPLYVGESTAGIPEWYWNLIYRLWSIGSAITPSNNNGNKPTKLLYMTAYPIFQHKNNTYIFLLFRGEKIVNGTRYLVSIMPTARKGLVGVIVAIGSHIYEFLYKVTPSDWPVLRIDKSFDGYGGLVVRINRTFEYRVHIKINKTGDKLVVRSKYSGEFLDFTYYISIEDNMFYMKVNIVGGLPPILATEIIVHYKGDMGYEELKPYVYTHGTTGGIVDMGEHLSLIGTLSDIDYIVVYVQAMAGYVTIYFDLSS